MNGQPKVSVFLSSPADVVPEREAAEWVVQRLNGVYAAHVELVAKRWEQHFYEADRGFQEAIAPMETFDVVAAILWKRIGSELPPDRFSRSNGTPYESGTVYEIETALAASRRAGRPSVYVFKSERPITYTAERVDAERAQKEALDRWWGRTFRDEAGRYVAATNSFGDTEDFEVKFENCLVDWLRDRGHIPDGPIWDVEAQGSPYPGLVAYDRKHSPVFFGRHLAIESAREELLGAAARESGRPALFVIGASGSGKSSLVRAGLVPRLAQPGLVPGVDLWRTVIAVPAADSLGPLAAHLYAPDGLPELAESAQRDPEKWARMAVGDPEAAADTLAWALDRIGEAERRRVHADRRIEARLLLVVDQLEGLFGTPGQKAFAKVLRALVGGGQAWLLATLRSDRYADLQLDRDLVALKRAGATYDLPPPGPAEITDIVKGPARAAGLAFGERAGGSLARVLVEAAPNADALPLLQMTLAQLFERREGAELTFAAYEAMGGVEGAIAAYADSVFARIAPVAQRELKPLIRVLVRDVARSRSDNQVRFTARDADRKAFEISEARKHLIEFLVEGRLLVSDGGKLRVAHEALLRRWERVQDSLRRLADAELRKARLQRALAIAAAVVFLAVAGVAVWQGVEAQRQTQIAQEQEAEAKRQRDQALRTQSLFLTDLSNQQIHNGDKAAGMLLALEALPDNDSQKQSQRERPYVVEAEASLYQSLDDKTRPVFTVEMSNERAVLSASFRPDRKVVVLIHTDGRCASITPSRALSCVQKSLKGDRQGTTTVAIFDVESGRLIRVMKEYAGPITYRGTVLDMMRGYETASFSHDGKRLVTSSLEEGTEIWDADSGELLLSSGKNLTNASFSPDGARVLGVVRNYNQHTRYWEGSVGIWDAYSGSHILSIASPQRGITSASFSPDGTRVLTSYASKGDDWEGGIDVWDANSGSHILGIKSLQDAVGTASFSPDGALIISGSANGRAEMWDATNGLLLHTLGDKEGIATGISGLNNHVNSASFSPNGQYIVTAYNDGMIREWDAKTGMQLAILTGHTDIVHSAAFSGDGRRIVTASSDGKAKIWHAFPTTQDLITHIKGVVPRCLSDGERRAFLLSPDMPNWCSGMAKWPVDGSSPDQENIVLLARQIAGMNITGLPLIGIGVGRSQRSKKCLDTPVFGQMLHLQSFIVDLLDEYYSRRPENRGKIAAISRDRESLGKLFTFVKEMLSESYKTPYSAHGVDKLVEFLLIYHDKFQHLTDEQKKRLADSDSEEELLKRLPKPEHECLKESAGNTYESLHHWFLSFWNRRYLEGNADVVLDILKWLKNR